MTYEATYREPVPTAYLPMVARTALDASVRATHYMLIASLERARYEGACEAERARLRLEYGALFHREEDVFRFATYCVAQGWFDHAVAVLEGWARNPWRTAGA